MNTIHRRINPVTLAILAILCVPAAQAELVNEAWVVRSGDGLYSIARKLAPKDLKLQARIRSEISQLNPGVNTENLEIGLNLKLPVFLFKQPEPAPAAPAALPEAPAPVQVSQPAVVTPDPQEIIGKVVIQSGNMVAENRGSSRKLNRTASILKGDTLKTAGNTRSQIRMKDGALIAISPNTELRIENYAYNGSEDGTERSVINLIKGGFRTITGAIGHVNKQNYQVKTSVATIGIRGTHYGLMLCEGGSCQNNPDMGNLNDGLYGGVVDGSVVADNASGQFAFNNDQYFHIQSQQMPPVETLLPPPVFQDAPPHGGEQPPRDDMANGPKPEGPNGQPPDNQRGMGPDGKGPGPMPGMAPGFQPNGPEGGMMAGDFQFNRNPMGMNFFNNDFLPPRDFQFMPGQPQNNIGNTGLPPPAPPGSGIAIAFTSSLSTISNDHGTAASIYIREGNPNGIFLERWTDPETGQVIGNLPFGIHEAHDVIDPQTLAIIGHQEHEATRLYPGSTGTSYQDLGGNPNFGVNWGRWEGDFLVKENGVALLHDGNFHFIYSDRLTPKDTLFNLGGLRSRIGLYTFAGGTLPTHSNPANNIYMTQPQISMGVDFVNHSVTNYDLFIGNTSTNWHAWLASPVDFSNLGDSFDLAASSTLGAGGTYMGRASVMFVGDMAYGAMTSYSIFDSGTQGGLSGAAFLLPPGNTAADGSSGLFASSNSAGNLISFASTLNNVSSDNMYVDANTNPVAAVDRWVDATSQVHHNSMFVNNPSTATLAASGIDTTTVAGTTVYWGRWNSTTVNVDAMQLQNVATDFIGSNNITTPTQLAGLTGTMLYGATGSAVHAYDGTGTQITGITVTMSYDFDTDRMTAYDIVTPALSATLAAPVDFVDLGKRFNLVDPNICTGNCVSGYGNMQLIGANADGAITSFAIQDATLSNSATGTAVMVNGW